MSRTIDERQTTMTLLFTLVILMAVAIPLTFTVAQQTTFHDEATAQMLNAQQTQLSSNRRVSELKSEQAHGNHPIVTLNVMNVIAKNNLGPLSSDSDDDLRMFSKDIVDNENTILLYSGARVRIKLVQTVFVNTSPTPKKNTSGSLLNAWETRMPANVVNARRQNNADIVAVLTTNVPRACGVAKLNSTLNARNALAIVDLSCNKSIDDTAYAHELGHAFGFSHDREEVMASTKDKGIPEMKDSNAYGFTNNIAGFRDIMSYGTSCTRSNGCPIIPMYSTTTTSAPILAPKDIDPEDYSRIGDKKADTISFMNSHLKYYAAMNYNAGN